MDLQGRLREVGALLDCREQTGRSGVGLARFAYVIVKATRRELERDVEAGRVPRARARGLLDDLERLRLRLRRIVREEPQAESLRRARDQVEGLLASPEVRSLQHA